MGSISYNQWGKFQLAVSFYYSIFDTFWGQSHLIFSLIISIMRPNAYIWWIPNWRQHSIHWRARLYHDRTKFLVISLDLLRDRPEHIEHSSWVIYCGLSVWKKIRQWQGIHAGGSQIGLEDFLDSAKTFEIRNLLSFLRILWISVVFHRRLEEKFTVLSKLMES